jgi:hypothetical protein
MIIMIDLCKKNGGVRATSIKQKWISFEGKKWIWVLDITIG